MCKEKGFMNTPMDRRNLLRTLGTLGASMVVVGCGGTIQTSDSTGGTSTDSDSLAGGGTTCTPSASETNGPFPADGSNSAGDGGGILDQIYPSSPIIRTNIATDTSNGAVISGVSLNLTLTLQNTNNSCAILSDYYIYIWHCTPRGVYSAYSGSMNGGTHSRAETYLRGIQKTDSNGQVNFATVYPGWYRGRAVHIHVEVYRTLSGSSIKTTQMAFPMATNNTVQATSGYNGVSGMLANSSDNIFSDGTSTEMLAVSGDINSGFHGSLILRVAA